MEEAQQLCDRIVVMHQGKILKEGVPSRLIEEEIGREVVEIRVAPDQDERLIAELGRFACGHERVGDTLYFYCRDGHDLAEEAGRARPAQHRPPAGDARGRLPEADRTEPDRMNLSYRIYHVFVRNLVSYKRFVLPTFIASLVQPLFYLITFGIGMGAYIGPVRRQALSLFPRPGRPRSRR